MSSRGKQRPIRLADAKVLARFRRGVAHHRPMARKWLMADAARLDHRPLRILKSHGLIHYDVLADRAPGRSRAQARLTPAGIRALEVLPHFCRTCGCTELQACAGGCSWVEPDLCSACVPH